VANKIYDQNATVGFYTRSESSCRKYYFRYGCNVVCVREIPFFPLIGGKVSSPFSAKTMDICREADRIVRHRADVHSRRNVMYINNNANAMGVANTLTSHYGNLATSTQRLSSGLRINSAADDAAGLAIRELMRSDITAMQQGIRNANDAISLIQTADGALGVIDEKLIRMKELAEQAATGTYTSTQRLMIDSEYQQMASEITRIANATDFNGIHLLNGNLSSTTHKGSDLSNASSPGKMKIHFGTANDSAEDYYYIQIGTSTASALGVGNTAGVDGGKSVSTQDGAQKAIVALNKAITSKDKIRANLGAMQNRLENTISTLQTQSENLQAAESRISDVDVASEMTRFVRNQILTQSAVAMLSQANSMPQMAMQLIG